MQKKQQIFNIKDGLRFDRLIVIALGMFFLPFIVFSATSTNYNINQGHGGPIELDATSTNYQFKAEIGHPGAGQSTSTNYIFDHGTTWMESTTTPVTATIQWAVPESRVGSSGMNDDAGFYLTVRTSDNSDNVVLFTSGLASTSDDGTYSTQITFTDINSGTYDIGLKGAAHLTKILQDVDLVTGNNVLNFTQADNSASKGSVTLDAGDVSGDGGSVANLGDDVVNSVDLSIILGLIDNDDPTGNGVRSNLNQDTVVNSVDLSSMLSNLDQEGDT